MKMLARAACFVACLHALPALAQTAVFTESWEAGAGRWRTSDAAAIAIVSETTPVCSTNFQRETTAASGGHAFSLGTAAANQIPVTAGMPHCLTAWIRSSTGTTPFLGFILDDGSGGAAGMQHWMIGEGSVDNDYGGKAVQVTADGTWRWYKAAFTPEAGANYIVVDDELYMSGAGGSADFDDIQVWQGACPATAPGVDAHVACSGTTPLCSTATGACVECTASMSGACSAGGTGSICLGTESCGCTADAHCGGATSGRICNLTTNVCAAGCRGPGGNGCPAGMVCSSSDSNPGACAAPGADLSVANDLGAGSPADLGVANDLAVAPDDLSAAPGDLANVTGVAGGGGCSLGGGGSAGLASDGGALASDGSALGAFGVLFGLALALQLRRRARR
jgi:hypothetical protein